jgi:uncharacterized protein (TIGR04206 family)
MNVMPVSDSTPRALSIVFTGHAVPPRHMWVRSEYAGELAVLSTWVTALLPWSVTVLRPRDTQLQFTLVVIRYAYFYLQFLLNLTFPEQDTLLWLHEVPGFVSAGVEPAAWAAVAGGALFTLPLGLSIAYYAAEERVEALPVDPVRLLGGLLGACALVYSASFALLWQNKAGLAIPVGVLFMWVFAVLLLTVDRD